MLRLLVMMALRLLPEPKHLLHGLMALRDRLKKHPRRKSLSKWMINRANALLRMTPYPDPMSHAHLHQLSPPHLLHRT
jgi:hypothetical protein